MVQRVMLFGGGFLSWRVGRQSGELDVANVSNPSKTTRTHSPGRPVSAIVVVQSSFAVSRPLRWASFAEPFSSLALVILMLRVFDSCERSVQCVSQPSQT